MKYHLKTETGSAACGAVADKPDVFIYDAESFSNHHAQDFKCKRCLNILHKQEKQEQRREEKQDARSMKNLIKMAANKGALIIRDEIKNLHSIDKVYEKDEDAPVKKTLGGRIVALVGKYREVKELSKEFVRILNEWLTPDELAEVNRKNATPDYIICCATHEYCDPNQAMIDAFKNIYGRECEAQEDLDNALINAAWDLSKLHKFDMNYYNNKQLQS